MSTAYLVAGVRTPIGRYAGGLAPVRTDDLAAHAVSSLVDRFPTVDWGRVDDVILGCANQAGEDNRNVARMAGLLAGLPVQVPGMTVNRLCASGLDAVGAAARAIRAGDADLVIAGGVESMTRAPLVMPKPDTAWSRRAEVHDSTIGWRFVNPRMEERYGTDSMPGTAQIVADEYDVSREDQDAFALRSQERAAKAIAVGSAGAGDRARRCVPSRKGPVAVVDTDEHPARPPSRPSPRCGRSSPVAVVTAGNVLWGQRRSSSAAHRLRRGGVAVQPDAARPDHDLAVGRRRAARHGHRP